VDASANLADASSTQKMHPLCGGCIL
jgi:hypothetical protein